MYKIIFLQIYPWCSFRVRRTKRCTCPAARANFYCSEASHSGAGTSTLQSGLAADTATDCTISAANCCFATAISWYTNKDAGIFAAACRKASRIVHLYFHTNSLLWSCWLYNICFFLSPFSVLSLDPVWGLVFWVDLYHLFCFILYFTSSYFILLHYKNHLKKGFSWVCVFIYV